MPLSFAEAADHATPLVVLEKDTLAQWLEGQTASVQRWVASNGFTAELGQTLLVPDGDATPVMALAGYGSASARARQAVSPGRGSQGVARRASTTSHRAFRQISLKPSVWVGCLQAMSLTDTPRNPRQRPVWSHPKVWTPHGSRPWPGPRP